jgi:ATP-dependent exoDNAse (exonuclease V) beta subunit
MTLHMAKGLEFPIVFITGCEDGLIPCSLMEAGVDIEEERRLFYVGMTRAKDELFLIHARSRFLYGQRLNPSPSPFLTEIPEKYIQVSVVPDKEKTEGKRQTAQAVLISFRHYSTLEERRSVCHADKCQDYHKRSHPGR